MIRPLRHGTFVLFSSALCVAVPSMASAADTQVELKIAELAANEVSLTIDAPAAGSWQLSVGGAPLDCRFTLTPGTPTLVKITKDGKCDALFKLAPEKLQSGTTEARLVLPPNSPIDLVLEQLDLATQLQDLTAAQTDWIKALDPEGPLKGQTVWYYDDGWKKLDIISPAPGVTDSERDVFVLAPGAKPKPLKIEKTKPAVPTADAKSLAQRNAAEADCATERNKRPTTNVLCFVYQGYWNRFVSGDTVMRPNQRILVLAYAARGTKVKIEMTGDVGFTDPKVRNETAGTVTAGSEEVPKLVVSPREWPALKPGVHTLTLTVTVAGEDDSDTVDIAVDEPYAGAVRIGVAGIFGGARDRTFAAETLPGSGQAEIVTSEGGMMDAELVIGVTAYLEDGGRTYFTGERHHWSPYFGIGVLDKDNTAFEVLRSVHLGIEYEISKQFSIAGTIVGRKVSRLTDGLEVGDPVMGATVSTRKGYELGVGIVVNVSPEFLKLGKSKMPGFFK